MIGDVDFDRVWEEIRRDGIDKLERMLESAPSTKEVRFSKAERIAVYSKVYNLCVQKGIRNPQGYCHQLYKNHRDAFAQYISRSLLPSLREKQDMELLQALHVAWEKHNIMNTWMKHAFSYLDRFYVMQSNVPKLVDSANRCFREYIYDKKKEDISKAVINAINRIRDGEDVDRKFVISAKEIFVAMGEGSLDLYTQDFEEPFLDASCEYYVRKAKEWLATEEVPRYLEIVEGVLISEANLVTALLDVATEPLLTMDLQHVLLAEAQEQLLENKQSGLRVMLHQKQLEDLARLFRLYERFNEEMVSASLEPIARIVRDYFLELGNKVVDERGIISANATGTGVVKDSLNNPAFVEKLLNLHDECKSMVTKVFKNHTRFQKAFKDAFELFVNKQVDGSKFSNMDVIAGYVDRILKGVDKYPEPQIDEILTRVIHLFSFIADKDVFGEIYRRDLSKRLIANRYVSIAAEKNMLDKLTVQCGTQYTSKMEGMLSDLSAAEALHAEFLEWYKAENKPSFAFEFTTQIFKSGWWVSPPSMALNYPSSVIEYQEVFEKFYTEHKFQHRKLVWAPAYSSATVTGYFGPDGQTTYDIQLSAIQAVCLLLFNKFTRPITTLEVRDALGCDIQDVKRTLHSLSCATHKILLKTPPDVRNIRDDDQFVINPNFAANVPRFKVPLATIEEGHNKQRVEEDRSSAIDACIVRIMKAKKTLTSEQIVNMTREQLKVFNLQQKVIKQRIEELIDRDYIERDSDDPSLLRYVA